MAYIGRDTDKISNVEVLDNITFDGSSSYTLQKNSVNFTPSSANTILLSIDGVVQAGNFTVSGSTIDFGTAVAGTSTCDFILHYGVGLITTPSDGTVTSAKIGTGAVTSSKLASGAVPNQSAFKNIIINGDMSIAQRGTSVSGITSASAGTVHAVDRMALAVDSAGTWTVSQETDAPSGQGFTKSLKFLCTTNQSSIPSGGYITFIQKFEGQNLQYLKYGTSNAQSLTTSFWIKSSKTGNFIVELANRDNNRYYGQLVSINTANTWEKKTVTYEGYTIANFDNDNAWSMDLQIWFGSGTGFTSGTLQSDWQNSQTNRAAGLDLQLHDTTNANVYITGVQLEAGTSASDFEFLPYDVNLQRCQRYFFSLGGSATYQTYGYGMCFSTTAGMIGVPYPTTMRSAPTVSTETLASFVTKSGSQLGGAPTSLVADFPGINFANVELGGLSSMTDKDALRLYTNNSTATRLEFSAEL